jgi:endoglucanase
MLAHPGVNWMVACAEENDIPYQLEVLEGGSTDARASTQPRQRGSRHLSILPPCTPVEMVDAGDVEARCGCWWRC